MYAPSGRCLAGASGSLRAHGRALLVGSLVVDIALIVFVRHHFSSEEAVGLVGAAFAILTMATALFGGAEPALAVGLFTGTVFYLFVAPSDTSTQTTMALLAVLLWNVAAVLTAVFGRTVSRRLIQLRTHGLEGRHVVVLPLPNDSAIEMRDALRAMLADHGVGETTSEQVVLATQEAYNNAVVQPPGTVEVFAILSREEVVVEVRDQGPGFDAAPHLAHHAPDPMQPSGRGLFLMQELMDEIEVTSSSEGCVVRLVKRVSVHVAPPRAPVPSDD